MNASDRAPADQPESKPAEPLRGGDVLHRMLTASWSGDRCSELDGFLGEVRDWLASARSVCTDDAEAIDRVDHAFGAAGAFVAELRKLGNA